MSRMIEVEFNPDNRPWPVRRQALLRAISDEEDVRSLSVTEATCWNRILEAYRCVIQAQVELNREVREFVAADVDHVAILRAALRGASEAPAVYAARSLPGEKLKELFPELILASCAGHDSLNVLDVRNLIASMPREWVLSHVEANVERLLPEATYWEYRRLLELYRCLDSRLTQALAQRAAEHPDAEIREAGEDFQDFPAGPVSDADP